MRTILLTIFLQLLFVTAVFGFDGSRTGFVAGFGLGIAPISSFSHGRLKEDKTAFAFHSFIGHGFNEKNVMVFEANLALRNSSYYLGIESLASNTYVNSHDIDTRQNITKFAFDDVNLTQGFAGVTWYHSFKPTKNSWFSALGLGLYNAYSSSFKISNFSAGFLAGIGHEFEAGLRLTGYFTHGYSNGGREQLIHNQLSLLVSYVKY